jgi:hypothetical protein
MSNLFSSIPIDDLKNVLGVIFLLIIQASMVTAVITLLNQSQAPQAPSIGQIYGSLLVFYVILFITKRVIRTVSGTPSQGGSALRDAGYGL